MYVHMCIHTCVYVFVYVVIWCVYVNYSVTRHGRQMFVMHPQSMDIAEVYIATYARENCA